MDYDEKILIIGGTSGIGAMTGAVLLAQHPGIKQCIPEGHNLNVTDRIGVMNYVREHGPFSHIVYSAGINNLQWIESYGIDNTMEKSFAVNCTGFVSIISQHIQAFPSARMSAVAVSSDAGRIPMRGSVAYCASKSALDMAVKVMARELAPLHRINAIAPGMVDGTPMTEYIDRTIPEFRGWTKEAALAYEKQNTPTGRRATMEEVAETIAWVLFGPEQMTGAVIDITGGR